MIKKTYRINGREHKKIKNKINRIVAENAVKTIRKTAVVIDDTTAKNKNHRNLTRKALLNKGFKDNEIYTVDFTAKKTDNNKNILKGRMDKVIHKITKPISIIYCDLNGQIDGARKSIQNVKNWDETRVCVHITYCKRRRPKNSQKTGHAANIKFIAQNKRRIREVFTKKGYKLIDQDKGEHLKYKPKMDHIWYMFEKEQRTDNLFTEEFNEILQEQIDKESRKRKREEDESCEC